MRTSEKAAKTVDDAIEEALRELQCSRDEVDIEVLDEGSKGFLGILGTKLARIRAVVKETQGTERAAEKASTFLREVLDRMGVEAAIESEFQGEILIFRLSGKDLGVLIGKHGQTLDSLQYLVGLVANRGNREGAERMRVVVDAEGYRVRREQTLRCLAARLADRVRREGRSASLEPMSASERRIIHTALQHSLYVTTRSEGEEPNRKVVVSPKPQAQGGEGRGLRTGQAVAHTENR